MTDHEPDHWLYRLTASEWLAAAAKELALAERALVEKQQRAGVAGARRAAGMAWNAVLVGGLDERFGRSYMDHLRALADVTSVPESVRSAARSLLEAPLTTNVIPLGKGDTRYAHAARTILDHARERAMPTASA